ncbi:MAG: signal peptidase I [Candidatus Nanoarchaeia archaeon]
MSFLKYTLAFGTGFIVCAMLVFLVNYSNLGVPFGTGFSVFEGKAPIDRVSEEDIIVFGDSILIRVPNATLSSYAPTDSMLPLLDNGANGIRVVPKNEREIQVGDIVTFRLARGLVIHRVVERGIDKEGVYFVTRGDNNRFNDEKIRFTDIEYVTIGVIW